MKSILDLPILRDLHARSLLFPTMVLLAVAGVLLHGALNPERREETGNPSQTTAELDRPALPTVRPALEKTPLTYVSDYWFQLARESRSKMLLIGRDRIPAIVVAPGVALSSIRAADDFRAQELEQQMVKDRQSPNQDPLERAEAKTSPVESEEGYAADEKTSAESEPEARPYTLLGVDAERELALFKLEMPYVARSFLVSDPTALKAGAYIAAMSLSPEGQPRVTPGFLVSLRPGSAEQPEVFDVSIPFSDDLSTAAIVDLDGALLGVAIESSRGIRVVSAETIQRIADRMPETAPCRSIEVDELTEQARQILGLRGGLLVRQVRRDSFLPEPSILPGDILLEWSGTRLDTTEQFNQLYQEQKPGALVRYALLRRQSRVVGGTVMPDPDCRSPAEALVPFARMGVILQWAKASRNEERNQPEGWKVMGRLEDSPASAGGLMRNDRIVAVQHLPVTQEDAREPFEKFERRPQPLVLTVWRDGFMRLIAVSPLKE